MSDQIPFSRRVVVPDTVLFRELEGEAVILSLETESYLGLDAIGTGMWKVLTAQPSIEAAYRVLLTEYDVEPARLRADLQRLLEEMLDHKLITLKDE